MPRKKNILLLEEMTSAFLQVREAGLGKNMKLHFTMSFTRGESQSRGADWHIGWKSVKK